MINTLLVRATAIYPNESWSMDFMSDAFYDGQRIKLLTSVDNFTRESLAIEVAYRLGGHGVVTTLVGSGGKGATEVDQDRQWS